jgi:hypothetical protein
VSRYGENASRETDPLKEAEGVLTMDASYRDSDTHMDVLVMSDTVTITLTGPIDGIGGEPVQVAITLDNNQVNDLMEILRR